MIKDIFFDYHSDVTGGRGAGIAPLLLDRNGFREKVSDCLRIRRQVGWVR